MNKTRVLYTLLAVCIARLWLISIASSFWVDELVTAFVVRFPAHPTFSVAPQVPQSIYYWLPRIADSITGFSEISYRIPSILAMGLALYFVARLAARIIHPDAAWFAVFACFSLRGIDYHAIDARPYALGMCLIAAALYFLVRWFDSAHWLDATLFLVSALLVWRVHPVYWPFYLVPAIYVCVRLIARDTPVGFRQIAVVAAILAAGLTPVALVALSIARQAHTHVMVPPPTLHIFEHELRWNLVILAGACVWIASRLLRWPNFRGTTQWSGIILVFSWWLVHPVMIFLYSRITGNSVYIGRYLSMMLPGAALSASVAASFWMPPQKWKTAAMGMAIIALIAQGHWTEAVPRHDISDWRAAHRTVNNLVGADSETPVICPSPFIEARTPVWTPDYPLPGFLYSHLFSYPVRGKLYLLPFLSKDGDAYTAMLTPMLATKRHFLIYGGEANANYLQLWFSARPELAEWKPTVHKFGDVYVVDYWK